jgi:PAS domain S-box-containing protein
VNLDTHRPTSPPASLADVLDSRREDIIHQWTERLREDLAPGPHSRASLRNHIEGYLQELAVVLHRAGDEGTAAVPQRSAEARAHGSQRLCIGFDLTTLVHEYGVLHECILDQVAQTGVRISLAEVRLLVSSTIHGIAEAVDAYTRQRDEAQHLNEARLQALLDHAPVAIYAKDAEGRYLISNRHQQEVLGRSREEILGHFTQEIFPEEADTFRSHDAQALAGHTCTFEEVIHFPSGPRTYLSVKFPLPGAEGLPAALGGISTDITERKEAEATHARLLREAEAQNERLGALFQEAPAIIFALRGPEHILTLANPRLYEAIGAGREVLGKPLRDALPELEEQGWRVLLDNVYRTGEPAVGHEVRVWVYRHGGPPAECFFNFVYAPTRGPDGRVDGVFVHAVEVTELVRERQKAEEALALLDTLLTTAPVGLSFLDRDLRYVRVNQMLADIIGVPLEHILGQDVDEVVPALTAQLAPIRRQVLETGQPVLGQEVMGTTPATGGEVRHWLVNHSPVRNRAGEVILVAGAVLDITERKRAEHATEERFRLLLEGTLLSQSLDVHTTLKSLASLVVSHLADYCMVDLLGEDGQLHRLALMAREPERQALIHRSMTSPPHVGDGGLMLQSRADGTPLAVPEVTPAWLDSVARDPEHRALLEALSLKSVILMPLVARGRKLGIISFAWSRLRPTCTSTDLEVARGVADRAAMALDNARLYQEAQEAIRVREDVVAIVSHDLRTPLNAISLSAATLLKREDVDERTLKTVRRILAAADRASRMIHDLLDFTQARTRGIPVHREPLDFHEHVRRVMAEVRLAWPERRITFHASGDGQGEWDGGRLAQVVTNLVGNALQHSPEGTPVRVSTRGEDSSILLEVHNEGRPISPEALQGLFEPYRRGPEAGTRQGSLGLGLFITRQIVLGHGGTLDVHSSEEEGTTFSVRLPRHPN